MLGRHNPSADGFDVGELRTQLVGEPSSELVKGQLDQRPLVNVPSVIDT